MALLKVIDHNGKNLDVSELSYEELNNLKRQARRVLAKINTELFYKGVD